MLDIEAVEKELAEIAGEIRKEADRFRTGTSFLKSAQNTVEVNIDATSQLLEEFKKVSSDFRGLEGRITSVDFSRYFEGLADHLKTVSEKVEAESSALERALRSLSEAQQTLKSSFGLLGDLPKKVESKVDSLSAKIKETETAVAAFRKEYSEAKIPEGMRDVSRELEGVQKEQLGLAERNKVLQEGLNRIQEKQADIFLLIKEAQKKRESTENQLVESLRSMEEKLMQKVKLCLAFGGVALVALAVLLAKVFG